MTRSIAEINQSFDQIQEWFARKAREARGTRETPAPVRSQAGRDAARRAAAAARRSLRKSAELKEQGFSGSRDEWRAAMADEWAAVDASEREMKLLATDVDAERRADPMPQDAGPEAWAWATRERLRQYIEQQQGTDTERLYDFTVRPAIG
jgi:hypothetical protein